MLLRRFKEERKIDDLESASEAIKLNLDKARRRLGVRYIEDVMFHRRKKEAPRGRTRVPKVGRKRKVTYTPSILTQTTTQTLGVYIDHEPVTLRGIDLQRAYRNRQTSPASLVTPSLSPCVVEAEVCYSYDSVGMHVGKV